MSLNSRKSPKKGGRVEEGESPIITRRKRAPEDEEDMTWSSCTKFWAAIFVVVAVSSLIVILIATVPGSTDDLMHQQSSMRAPQRAPARMGGTVKNYDFSKYLQQVQSSDAKREVAEVLQTESNTTGTTATLSEQFQTNITHEGKQLDMIIHFTFDSVAVMLAYQKMQPQSRKSVSQPVSAPPVNSSTMPVNSAAECAPGYTLGVNWTLGVNYMIDTASISTLSPSFAVSTIEKSVASWNTFIGKNVFGSRIPWTGTFEVYETNGKNEITFGSISPTNILAVAIVYGYFSGPVSDRQIVEADVIFADASQTLGDCTLDPTTHDYPRVCMHELGHFLGFWDVYLAGCDLWTIMFGSSPAGRVQPRGPLSYSDGVSAAALYPDDGLAEVDHSQASTLDYWFAIYLCYVIVVLQYLY